MNIKSIGKSIIPVLVVIQFLVYSQLYSQIGPVKINFEIDRHKIIIPTSINNSKPLRLILDTGMRFDGVFLFHKEAAKLIDTTMIKNVIVPGAGNKQGSESIMIESATLNFSGDLIENQKVIISQASTTQSFPTDGVIGWNLFGHYKVEINYDNRTIILHDSTSVIKYHEYEFIPIELKSDIPWIKLETEVTDGNNNEMLFYIDLASSDVLEMLTHADQKYKLPQNLEKSYLGTGLSGDIYGFKGKSKSIRIGDYILKDLPTSFAPREIRSKQDGADGILGNRFFEKFNVIFDYFDHKIYFKPNKSFSSPFDF